MSVAARAILFGLAGATYLVAAKAHGRQLRLERQLAGYWQVRFGAENPPWVQRFWRRERAIYWTSAAIGVTGLAGYAVLASRLGWAATLAGTTGAWWLAAMLLLVIGGLTLGFVIAGLLSLGRFAASARRRGQAPHDAAEQPARQPWVPQAAWGSAAWWAATLGLLGALLFSSI